MLQIMNICERSFIIACFFITVSISYKLTAATEHRNADGDKHPHSKHWSENEEIRLQEVFSDTLRLLRFRGQDVRGINQNNSNFSQAKASPLDSACFRDFLKSLTVCKYNSLSELLCA